MCCNKTTIITKNCIVCGNCHLQIPLNCCDHCNKPFNVNDIVYCCGINHFCESCHDKFKG